MFTIDKTYNLNNILRVFLCFKNRFELGEIRIVKLRHTYINSKSY